MAFSIANTSSSNRSAPDAVSSSTRSSRNAFVAETRMIPNTFNRNDSPVVLMF